MANKKGKQKIKAVNLVLPPPQLKKNLSADEKDIKLKPSQHFFIIAGIVIVTCFFLKACLANLFTNWDDPGYVVNDGLIKNFSAEGIKNIFSLSGGAVMGNYHPLTILTYAIEYSFVRLEPWLYHLDSLLLHLLCTVLVYWFISLLCHRRFVAAMTALLFGIHPMHVESVAWIAGRKDVLYGVFYLTACIVYIYGLRATGVKKWIYYPFVIILFIFSLLAKPVAVSLPLTLLLIDYFEKKLLAPNIITAHAALNVSDADSKAKSQINYTLLLQKIPFFFIAILFGLQSISDQKKFGAFGTLDVSFNPIERIALGSYALITYLWKSFIPAGLSCFYPYPEKINGTLPGGYYIYPLILLIICFLIWRFARKNKAIIFGLLFFLVNIGLLLQFIPVGGAILADRYTYIPYIGLFFLAGRAVAEYFEKSANRPLAYTLAAAVVIYSCCLGYYSSERCKVWYNATTLWVNEIEEHPNVPNAYNNLGFYYFNKFSDETDPVERKIYYDSSYSLLNRSIELQAHFANPYISLGELQRTAGDFNSAKKNYYKALAIHSKDEDANAYLGLAIIYAITHNFDSSSFCFRTALSLQPYFPEAHSNYGNFLDMTGKPDSSLLQYGIAIAQNQDLYAAYLNRGRELQRLKRCEEAFKDFEKAIEISPANGEVFYSRSYCYTAEGNKALALQDVEKAISLHFTQIDGNYYQMLKTK